MLELIIIPIIITAVTQMMKLAIDGIPKNFTWQHLINNYGGMPSSHTAYVTSLTTLVALRDGLDSTAFAIAVVVMIVVIRDAIGFRREIGRNALLTNTIAEKVFSEKADLLNEQVGHSVAEAAVGFVLGIVLAVILHAGWMSLL